MTLEEAKNLKFHQDIFDRHNQNFKGEPARWRVNGAIKLWKTDPTRIRVPIKHGLYSYDAIEAHNLNRFTLEPEELIG